MDIELTPKQKGNVTETQCLVSFLEKGLTVSIPYGDCARYDFIIEYKNKLLKVQCKTSHVFGDNEGFVFSSRSANTNYSRRYTKDEIDYFCTYYNGVCYLIPIEECSVFEKRLRFKPPKNHQKAGIHYAQEYELENQLSKII